MTNDNHPWGQEAFSGDSGEPSHPQSPPPVATPMSSGVPSVPSAPPAPPAPSASGLPAGPTAPPPPPGTPVALPHGYVSAPPPAPGTAVHTATPPSGGVSVGGILGILSVVVSCLGLILGPIAIIVSIKDRKDPRKSGFALAGIITGILGTIFGLGVAAYFAFMMTLPTLYDYPGIGDDEDVVFEDFIELPEETPVDESEEEFASLYGGGLQETPCYSFEGSQGWILNTSAQNIEGCSANYELWAEYAQTDTGELVIGAIGTGSVVAQVIVEPLSTTFVDQSLPASGSADIVDYLDGAYFSANGHTVVDWTETTLGGLDAIRFSVDTGSSDFRSVYLVSHVAPRDLGGEDTVSGFLITVSSQFDEIVSGAAVDAAIQESWTWK